MTKCVFEHLRVPTPLHGSRHHHQVDGLGAPTAANDWGSKLIKDDDPTLLAIATWKQANASAASLFESHVAAMAELQRPGIEVHGNSHLAKIINSSVFSLLTTYRADEHFGGAASGGLCGDAYAGGTGGGWDLETWQLPWLLFFYPQMTRSLLQYRIDRQAAASVIAHTTVGPPTIRHNVSWDGLRYPIMAALTGLGESCELHSGSAAQCNIPSCVILMAFGGGHFGWIPNQACPCCLLCFGGL